MVTRSRTITLVRSRPTRRRIPRKVTIKRTVVKRRAARPIRPRVILNSNRAGVNRRRRRIPKKKTNKMQMMDKLPQAVKSYMHCRLNPFASSGALGIPDASNTPRVVVDHRLICNFTAGSSSGFYIAVMPWMPHPLMVQPLNMHDATWLYNGVHPTANLYSINDTERRYWFAPATLVEWKTAVTRNAAAFDYDTVTTPYSAKRFRFITIGAKVMYTGSTMNNSGSILVNDGSFMMGDPIVNTDNFTALTSDPAGSIIYSPNEVTHSMLTFSPNFELRSNSSLNEPIRLGAFTTLINQAGDHPWQDIPSSLNFASIPTLAAYSVMTANSANPISDGYNTTNLPCVQAWDQNFSPKIFNITNMAAGSTFQMELVYCVEYAIGTDSNLVSLARQPPSYPQQVQQVDAIVKEANPNKTLGQTAVETATSVVNNAVSTFIDNVTPKPPRITSRIR